MPWVLPWFALKSVGSDPQIPCRRMYENRGGHWPSTGISWALCTTCHQNIAKVAQPSSVLLRKNSGRTNPCISTVISLFILGIKERALQLHNYIYYLKSGKEKLLFSSEQRPSNHLRNKCQARSISRVLSIPRGSRTHFFSGDFPTGRKQGHHAVYITKNWTDPSSNRSIELFWGVWLFCFVFYLVHKPEIKYLQTVLCIIFLVIRLSLCHLKQKSQDCSARSHQYQN